MQPLCELLRFQICAEGLCVQTALLQHVTLTCGNMLVLGAAKTQDRASSNSGQNMPLFTLIKFFSFVCPPLGCHLQVPVQALRQPSPQRGMYHHCFQSGQRHCWCCKSGGGQQEDSMALPHLVHALPRSLVPPERLGAMPVPSGVGCVLWFDRRRDHLPIQQKP